MPDPAPVYCDRLAKGDCDDTDRCRANGCRWIEQPTTAACPDCGGSPDSPQIIEVEGDRMTPPGGETCNHRIHDTLAAEPLEVAAYDSPASATAAQEEVRSMDEINAALASLIDKKLRDAEVIAVDDAAGDRWKLRLTATDGTEVVLGTQDADGYQSWLVLESINA